MPTPTDYIFQSGSCAKKDLYQLILDKLIEAGWTDVASNPTTEYNILTSTGVNDDKELVIQLRPIPAAGTVANNVTTSNYSAMSYRLQTSYTPGKPGVSGVLGRPTSTWIDLMLAPTIVSDTLAADTIVTYKVYADKNRIILGMEYPSGLWYNPVLFYLGQPDTVWMSESKSAGCVCATSALATTAGSLNICDSPDDIASVNYISHMSTKALLPLKNPNNGKKHIASDIIYENSTQGMRGKLDGILCVLNSNVLTGDNYVENGKTYYAFVCATQGNTSFPSQAIVVRTE